MADVKHTPGPWVTRPPQSPNSWRVVSRGTVAEILSANPEADARLIAAAPELLAFIKQFVEAWDEGMGGDSSLYRGAKAAITKAEGQP